MGEPVKHVCDESCGIFPDPRCPIWDEHYASEHRLMLEQEKKNEDVELAKQYAVKREKK